MAKSEQAHVADRGARCPVCDSEEIEGDEVTTGAGGANQEMVCMRCDASWYDCYTLTGYMGLRRG